jgi:ubiquinone/menaquinone biosynthesis C-methylase UbiE
MREGIIQYYLCFLPPRGVESILNIGGGTTDPYRKMLKPRCGKYANLDKRPGINVDFVCDILDGTPFRDKEWTWVWCSEVIEHIPQNKQQQFVDEIVRICKNVVFTFPTPKHPSFHLDPEHVEVIADFNYPGFDVDYRRTKTGRCIITLQSTKQKSRATSVDEWL